MGILKSVLKIAAPVAGAAIGGAVGGPLGAKIGGSLGGALGGAVAKKGAANVATAANLAGINEARQAVDTGFRNSRAVQDPYLNLGVGGTNALMGRLNLPTAPPAGTAAPAPGANDNALTMGATTPAPGAGVQPPPVAGATPVAGAAPTSPGTFGNGTNPTWSAPAAATPGVWQDPGKFEFGVDQFRASPGYQYQVDESTRAIESLAGAQGSRLSGNTLKAISDRAGHLADQDWNAERAFARGSYDTDRNFSRDVYRDDRDYDRSVLTGDREFERGTYTDDRDYLTGRFDRGTDDLFRTAAIGQGAAGVVSGDARAQAGINADLALGGGAARADNALTQGGIDAGLVSGIGGLAGEIYDEYGRRKQNALNTDVANLAAANPHLF